MRIQIRSDLITFLATNFAILFAPAYLLPLKTRKYRMFEDKRVPVWFRRIL